MNCNSFQHNIVLPMHDKYTVVKSVTVYDTLTENLASLMF